jgi:alkylated DNA repair protein (DNA oxidative demethylase)
LPSRAPSERPDGLVYEPELLSVEGERGVLAFLEQLEFHAVVMHGQAAKRTVRHYGYDYDYERRDAVPGEPIPEPLLPVRDRAAALAELDPESLEETLVTRYPAGAGIGWHRDAPMFGAKVVGVSLRSACRMRFQRGSGDARRVWELVLEPRSGYVLGSAARSSWQHSIPATQDLRYSITFRTLRRTSRSL